MCAAAGSGSTSDGEVTTDTRRPPTTVAGGRLDGRDAHVEQWSGRPRGVWHLDGLDGGGLRNAAEGDLEGEVCGRRIPWCRLLLVLKGVSGVPRGTPGSEESRLRMRRTHRDQVRHRTSKAPYAN